MKPESQSPPKPKELTEGEQRAFRMGVLRGLELGAEQLGVARIRVAAKSLEVVPPSHWPERGQ